MATPDRPAERPTATDAAAERISAAAGGSVRALARLLTTVENGGTEAAAVAEALTGRPRTAHIIGITGAPGAGKSTLTGALLRHLRGGGAVGGGGAGAGGGAGDSTGEAASNAADGHTPPTVAVLAVDPSSPLTGGALLGDRVRMADHATDPGIYIRSLSSRGKLGGLSAGTPAAVDLLSALGFDIVIVETVGVGQSEVDVMNQADTVAVVLAPGMGDAVQAAKAGIMEIADLLVVNKADHEGARTTARELRAVVALGRHPDDDGWEIPVLTTVAETGSGVPEFTRALARHRDYLVSSGELSARQARRAESAVRAVAMEEVRRTLAGESGRAEIARAANSVIGGRVDFYRAAEAVLDWLRHGEAETVSD